MVRQLTFCILTTTAFASSQQVSNASLNVVTRYFRSPGLSASSKNPPNTRGPRSVAPALGAVGVDTVGIACATAGREGDVGIELRARAAGLVASGVRDVVLLPVDAVGAGGLRSALGRVPPAASGLLM